MAVDEKPLVQQQTQNRDTDTGLTPADEERLRILANLIIDRMLEDYAKGKLKFQGKPVIMGYRKN